MNISYNIVFHNFDETAHSQTGLLRSSLVLSLQPCFSFRPYLQHESTLFDGYCRLVVKYLKSFHNRVAKKEGILFFLYIAPTIAHIKSLEFLLDSCRILY